MGVWNNLSRSTKALMFLNDHESVTGRMIEEKLKLLFQYNNEYFVDNYDIVINIDINYFVPSGEKCYTVSLSVKDTNIHYGDYTNPDESIIVSLLCAMQEAGMLDRFQKKHLN